MVRVSPSCAIDRRFEPRSGITKDYKIGMCCFSVKHVSKTTDGLARNQDNVSVRGNMSIRGLGELSVSFVNYVIGNNS